MMSLSEQGQEERKGQSDGETPEGSMGCPPTTHGQAGSLRVLLSPSFVPSIQLIRNSGHVSSVMPVTNIHLLMSGPHHLS